MAANSYSSTQHGVFQAHCERTVISAVARICAAVLIGIFAVQADGQGSVPVAPVTTCQQMLNKVRPMVLKMPAGVEKMAAQKEIASAQTQLDKGAETECRTHVQNVTVAMKDHDANQ